MKWHVKPANVGLGLFIAVLIVAAASAAWADWIYEIVASVGDQGQFASIAVDSENIPHVAWYDSPNGKLYYSYRSFTGWHTEQIDAGNRGYYASIAVNPLNDYPAIAYYAQADEMPKYAWWDGSNWQTETINDPDSDNYIGDYIDLVFSQTGVAWTSYHYDNGAFHTMGMKTAYRNSPGSWSTTRVDTTTSGAGIWEFGRHTSIAVSTADLPQVAYRDDFLGFQKFAYYQSGSWHTETAVDFEQAGQNPDIALDVGDNIYISSYNTEILGNECACIISKYSGEWSLENVDCGDDEFGKYSSIEVDSTGSLHLTYSGENQIHYGVKTAGEWTIMVLDEENTNDLGDFNGLALDSVDRPYIVYYDATAKDLIFAFELEPPIIEAITPDNAPNTAILDDAVIDGDLFEATSTVKLVKPDSKVEVNGINVLVLNGQSLRCDFNLVDAEPGYYDVVVSNQAGNGTLADGFLVTTQPPELDSISPTTANNDETELVINLTGDYFLDDMTVKLIRAGESDIPATAVAVYSYTSAGATFNLQGAAVGSWSMYVQTPFGNATLAEAFDITCADPAADFNAAPKQGPPPLTVQFANATVEYEGCEVVTWSWTFGDGGTSDLKNPQHIYDTPGAYTVSLTATSATGSDTMTKQNYIQVNVGDDDDDDTVDDDDVVVDDDDDDTMADDDTADDDDEATDDDDDNNPPSLDDDDDFGAADDDDDDSSCCGC